MSVWNGTLLLPRSTSVRSVQSRAVLSFCGVQPSVAAAQRSFPWTIADWKFCLSPARFPPFATGVGGVVWSAMSILVALVVTTPGGVPVIRTTFMKLFEAARQFQITYWVLSEVLAFTGVVGIESN